jgi:hypothetical protein
LNDIWAENLSSNSILLYMNDSVTKELVDVLVDSNVGRFKLLVWYRYTRYLWNWNSLKNYSFVIMSAKYGQDYVCICIII